MELDEFTLLNGKPIDIKNVGHIKSPTLDEICDITYETYMKLCNYLLVDLPKYLELTNLTDKYNSLSEEGKKFNTLYNLIIYNEDFKKAYDEIFSFFIVENVTFDKESNTYVVWTKKFNKNTKKTETIKIGTINNNNFDEIRINILQLNGFKNNEIKPEKYKNERARKIAEKLAKAEKLKKNKEEKDLSIGKMISKYCADNKNGINILNVYKMTIYQFLDQFSQHNHIRQSDIQDMIYANSVSFSDVKSYNSNLWLK